MPSKKILVVIIACIAFVVSFWLLFRIPADSKLQTVSSGNSSASVTSVRTTIPENVSGDWKSLLTSLPSTTDQATDLTTNDTSTDVSDDTSVTGQLAKDVFSRFMLVAKDPNGVSDDEANNISNAVLSVPAYTTTAGVVYVPGNLHINQKTDSATVKDYENAMELISIRRNIKNAIDPLQIVQNAMDTNDNTQLTKINPMIQGLQGVVSDLLDIEVPSDAVSVHLGLLNTYSALLSDVQAMQTIISDPIKSLAGMNSYIDDSEALKGKLAAMQTYFDKKL